MCSQSLGTIRWSHFHYGCPFRPPSCHCQYGQYWKVVREPLFVRDSYRKISNAQGSSTRVASMSRASTCSDSPKNPLRVMAGVQDMIEEADCLQAPNLVLRSLLYTRAQRYFTERLIGNLDQGVLTNTSVLPQPRHSTVSSALLISYTFVIWVRPPLQGRTPHYTSPTRTSWYQCTLTINFYLCLTFEEHGTKRLTS
jgi:hypothetical protein